MNDTLTPLDRARLLPAQIEIALVVMDLDATRSGTEELRTIAGTFGSRAFDAAAGTVREDCWWPMTNSSKQRRYYCDLASYGDRAVSPMRKPGPG